MTFLASAAAGIVIWGLLLLGVHLLFTRAERLKARNRAAFRARMRRHIAGIL